MKLLGVPLSPFVRKVAVVMKIKNLDYELQPVMPGDESPEFRSVSPLGKIPVLADGDFTLADSTAICEYLEEKYPGPPVMPADLQARAKARFLEEYGDSKFIEAAGVIFFEGFVNPVMFGNKTDTGRLEQAANEMLPQYLDYLESQAPAEGYLFGHFCTADISIVSPIFNAALGGFELDAARWPRYTAFVQRVAEHPAVVAVRDIEQQFMAQMQGG